MTRLAPNDGGTSSCFPSAGKAGGRTEDVGGIAPWIEPLPVPSRTPFVGAMLKRDKM